MRWLCLLLLALSIGGCCTGVSSDSLLYVGGQPTGLAGTGADDSAVVAALDALLDQRSYDPGMSMVWSCRKSNNSKLRAGPVATWLPAEAPDPVVPQTGQVSGTGSAAGPYYTMQFTLPAGQQLTVRFVYNSGQGLIYEVRPRSTPATSGTAIPADCHLTGTLDGAPVDLTFQQELHARRVLDGYSGYY